MSSTDVSLCCTNEIHRLKSVPLARFIQSEVGVYKEHYLRSKLSVMERNLKEVFRDAAQLPERDRATLAGLLIETLDPVSEPDVEAAWSEEIKRRVAEIEKRTVELIPCDG
ncbi:MAG: putative addiction module component [Blastocatellia bacterium]|nr:putative addiction module component [Blastocatellia bacterium]